MPNLANKKPKKWGKVHQAALHDPINDVFVDINNLSTKSIGAIHAQYFCHCKQRNFRCNFCSFATGTASRVSTAAQGGSKVSHRVDY